MINHPAAKRVTTAEFSAKFRSKYEVYQFLSIDALAYLPAPETVTIYFLKDLVRGVKKCKFLVSILTIFIVVKAEDAKNLHVPMYKGLSIDAILEKARQDENVVAHLPDERDISRLPRQWIINVVYSLIGEQFRLWVASVIRGRNEHLAE